MGKDPSTGGHCCASGILGHAPVCVGPVCRRRRSHGQYGCQPKRRIEIRIPSLGYFASGTPPASHQPFGKQPLGGWPQHCSHPRQGLGPMRVTHSTIAASRCFAPSAIGAEPSAVVGNATAATWFAGPISVGVFPCRFSQEPFHGERRTSDHRVQDCPSTATPTWSLVRHRERSMLGVVPALSSCCDASRASAFRLPQPTRC
jgi:hypothetical protein